MRVVKTVLILAAFLIPPSAWAHVFLRWSEPALPPARSLGVRDIVIVWKPQTALIDAARRQGYRVYAEVNPGEALAAASHGKLAGIFITIPASGPAPSQVETLVRELRRLHPGLIVRTLPAGGKQPQMRGFISIKKHHIRATSSHTAQPWIDSNVALIRYERAYDPGEPPLYDFEWSLLDPDEQKYGPPALDYELAVAEAGSFHADLILPIDPYFQAGLADANPHELDEWREIEHYIRFYAAPQAGAPSKLVANVAVVTNDYETSYEAVNLMARHNIPFRYIKPADLKRSSLQHMALAVAFGQLDPAAESIVRRFTLNGGVAVLVGGAMGDAPLRLVKKNQDSALYAAGKGQIAEIEPPVTNPEAFARDVWRLLTPAQRELRFWNALTTLAAAYRTPSSVTVDLVNYSGTPLRVQGRVKGSFSRIEVESPERECCERITPVKTGGFTEFIVPAFFVGARIHLSRGDE